MRSFPWDSIVEGLDEATGFPIYDRPYNAEDFRRWIMRFFSDGVFADDPNAFLCTATNSGMTINVSPGMALIKGTTALEDKTRTLSFEASDKNYARIDTVVLRWNANLEVRAIDLYVHKGTPAENPIRPELTRIEDQVWELGLCDVNIPANTAAISAARITDTRLETSRCGIVTPFAQFDTTSFYNLIKSKADEMLDDANDYMGEVKSKADDTLNKAQTDINNMKSDLQKQTDTAVDLAKSALEGTTAGHLQNQIDDINDYTTGINLLRGTRDFTVGTDPNSNNSVVFNDGFTKPNAEISKYVDKDGFTVISGKTTTGRSVYCSAINNFSIDEIFTISFDYKLNEAVIGETTIANCVAYNGPSSLISSTFKVKPNDEVGVWKKGVFTYAIPSTINEEIGLIVTSLRFSQNVNVAFKKIKVERGRIDNPIWSASPFDVAQQSDWNQNPLLLGDISNEYRLVNGDNLDNFEDFGVYKCDDNAIAPTLKNAPISYAFKLYVERSTGSAPSNARYPSIRQRLVRSGEGAEEYIRILSDTNSGWTPWRQTYANTTVRPIEGGGTGGITAREAQYNLLSDLFVSGSPVDDTLNFIFDAGDSKSKNLGAFVAKNGSSVWNWIASKIRSVFGFSSSNKLPTSRIDGYKSVKDSIEIRSDKTMVKIDSLAPGSSYFFETPPIALSENEYILGIKGFDAEAARLDFTSCSVTDKNTIKFSVNNIGDLGMSNVDVVCEVTILAIK